MKWHLSNEYLIALRQRDYLHAMLLAPHLITREQIKRLRYEGAPANVHVTVSRDTQAKTHDQHVKRYYQYQNRGYNWFTQFNHHVIEWQCELATRKYNAKLSAQQCAWDRSVEEIADDFYPLEKYGKVYIEAEPWCHEVNRTTMNEPCRNA